jgi:glycosyltransferase involved in cell wall biosynthesis
MDKIAALVPAYNPTERLVGIVRGLAESGFASIVVVNDGSDAGCDPLFAEVATIGKVTLLRHAVNLGKGAALKTGLNHAFCHFRDHAGVVTVDADGQHFAEDAWKVALSLRKHPDALVIGARGFDTEAPFRSRIGNRITRHLFRFLIGRKLNDTQSGLRGIPMGCIPSLLRISSSGYEFELDMLLACKYTGRRIVEEPIRTVYLEGNISSHFNPLIDSMKIYFVLFRFTLASLLSAILDSALFLAVFGFSASILISQASARTVSMLFNYTAVKRAVFFSEQKDVSTFPKYLALVIVSGTVSYFLIRFLVTFSSMSVLAAKISAESLVFLANFAIQRDFIFARHRRAPLAQS